MFPRVGKAGRCTVTLYVGGGPRGSNGTCSTLCWIAVTPSATHNQIGSLWCWFPSGWACAHCRPLWVFPMTPPVRLESLLEPPQPPRALSIRGLRLYFPALEPWVVRCASIPAVPPGLSMRKCGAEGCYPPLCLSHSPPL